MISGLGIIGVVVPLSFLIRPSPESMGLLPDGDSPPLATAREAPPVPVISRFSRHITSVDFITKEAIRTPAFWLFAVAMGLRVSAFSGYSCTWCH